MNHAEARAFSQFDRAVPEPREIDEQAVIDRANILQLEGERHDPFEPDNFIEALDTYFVRRPASAVAMMESIKAGFETSVSTMKEITIAYAKEQAMETAEYQLKNGD